MKELEEEWEKLGNERAVPSRFLRSQQAQQEKLAAEAAAAGQDSVDGKNYLIGLLIDFERIYNKLRVPVLITLEQLCIFMHQYLKELRQKRSILSICWIL